MPWSPRQGSHCSAVTLDRDRRVPVRLSNALGRFRAVQADHRATSCTARPGARRRPRGCIAPDLRRRHLLVVDRERLVGEDETATFSIELISLLTGPPPPTAAAGIGRIGDFGVGDESDEIGVAVAMDHRWAISGCSVSIPSTRWGEHCRLVVMIRSFLRSV